MKKRGSNLINLWIIQSNTFFEKHSPWDLQLACAVVSHAVSMTGHAGDICVLYGPLMSSLTENAQLLLQQHFCCPLCKTRAARNVSTKETELLKH